jgi:hypothetical protein
VRYLAWARAGLLAALAVILLQPVARAADRQAADDIADAVRDKGLACREAVSAERDLQASTADEAAWTLVCSDARYRVRFMGDASVRVEPLP